MKRLIWSVFMFLSVLTANGYNIWTSGTADSWSLVFLHWWMAAGLGAALWLTVADMRDEYREYRILDKEWS